MMRAQILTANEIPAQALNSFLQRMYPAAKSAFLIQHGAWQHRGNQNRFAALIDGVIAGYCALIPTHIWIQGSAHPAHWWVDLVVAPEARGQGLQTAFDEYLRARADLLLGFPNQLAAAIHKKHGWGVSENLRVVMLPLEPAKIKAVQRSKNPALKMIAHGLSPLAKIWSAQQAKKNVRSAWRIESLQSDTFAKIFESAASLQASATWRSREFFEWRYGESPYAEQFTYYLAGDRDAPQAYLIARHDKDSRTRILDIFSAHANPQIIRGLLTLAAQDALRRRSTQITMLVSDRNLLHTARQTGFILSAPVRFCWTSHSPAVMNALAKEVYWTFADSDNDE